MRAGRPSLSCLAAIAALGLCPGAAGAQSFSFGQLQATHVASSGCGTNVASEPAIRVSKANTVVVASERGVTNGSDVWRGLGAVGGSGANGCALTYEGQPNAVAGVGPSGGDVDLAIASERLLGGAYRIYLASLNLASVAVAHSNDNGASWLNVPIQAGIPADDRPWVAAFHANSSLLTFHDVTGGLIDVLRSDNGGLGYVHIGQAISPTSSAAANGALFGNQHGNIAIDRVNTAGTVAHGSLPGFWAYQSFVSFSSNPNATQFNEAYLGVSNNGGFTWNDREVPCSIARNDVGLNNQFPNVSVAPSGRIWMTWSAGTAATDSLGLETNVTSGRVFAASSADHGATWTCYGPLNSAGTAVMPWIAAGSSGVDLVYYQTNDNPTSSKATWSVRFQQFAGGHWGSSTSVTPVHVGPVCEGGANCTTNRQLFDDFGVANDMSGFAHIAYSHDAPSLGGPGSWTGSAVQTSGTTIGIPN